jgi:hypothetical protein
VPYDPRYVSPEGFYDFSSAADNPFQQYEDAVRQHAEDVEARRFGDPLPEEFGGVSRVVPPEIRQPRAFPVQPLYHRDEPESPDFETGHRSAGPEPYIPARHMKQVLKHYENNTDPKYPNPLESLGSDLDRAEQVDHLLQRLRESRTWPRSLIWGEEQSPML